MTICHHPDENGEYTDEQYEQHLLHSTCSECVHAGARFSELLKENKELSAALGNLLGKELGKGIAELIRTGHLEKANGQANGV